MSRCVQLGDWLTEEVTIRIEQWEERAETVCENTSRWVEREIRTPVERRRERQEERCAERPCRRLCACCNKWFCWIETVSEIIVEWIIRVVIEEVIETVCKTIVKLVVIYVQVVEVVVRFVLLTTVCLFSDRRRLGALLRDLWYDIVDIYQSALEVIDYVASRLVDMLEITAQYIDRLADKFGWLGVVISIAAGFIRATARVIDGLRTIFVAAVGVVLHLARLDVCRALRDLIEVGGGIGRTLTGFFPLALGIGAGAAGVRDWFVRRRKHEIVEAALAENFSGIELESVRSGLRMASPDFGAPWRIRPIRTQVHSRGKSLSILDLQNSTDVQFDLLAAAGMTVACGRNRLMDYGRIEVVYEGTSRPVRYSDLRRYLDGETVPDFVMIAVQKTVFERQIKTARNKALQLALHFEWDRYELFTLTDIRHFRFPTFIRADETVQSDGGVAFGDFLHAVHGVTVSANHCTLPMCAVFSFFDGLFGIGRSDTSESKEPQNVIGAAWRDFRPDVVFQTVPIHEAGHAFSLQHAGHEGVENIMYTADSSDGLSPVTMRTVAEYILLGGEPRFTLENVQTSWHWILRKASSCLPRAE